MDKINKTITYKELEELNEEGVVDKRYLYFKVYRDTKLFGTITKIDNNRIVVESA